MAEFLQQSRGRSLQRREFSSAPRHFVLKVAKVLFSSLIKQSKINKVSADTSKDFFDENKINLVQCAKQLEEPQEVLAKTYSNCTWQNETLSAVKGVAFVCNFGVINRDNQLLKEGAQLVV